MPETGIEPVRPLSSKRRILSLLSYTQKHCKYSLFYFYNVKCVVYVEFMLGENYEESRNLRPCLY